ncbi:MAG: hypothetical protein LBU89_13210 [Fibromonadaceae bacterium]|jgi:hypothetical protein|nr:hypothetical protein [Fibromonadaceae bacterium]
MLDFYPVHIYYPLEEAEKKYQEGALKQTETQLLDFVERHLEEIIDTASEEGEPNDESILDAVKGEILARGSIQPVAELADMLKEIHKEIWYKGEVTNCSQNPRDVAEQWQAEYAIKWREARLFEVFVVLEHCASAVLAKFNGVR